MPVLILGGDFNAQLGRNKGYKFAYHHLTNRNGKMLHNILKENKLIYQLWVKGCHNNPWCNFFDHA